MQAFLAAPVMARGRILGVIRLTIKEDLTSFTLEDEAFLQEVADRLAGRLDSLWRDEEATRKIQNMEQSTRLANQLSGAQSLQAICKTLAQEIFLATKAVGVYIRVVDEHFSRLAVTESVGLFKILQADGFELQLVSDRLLASNVQSDPAWKNTFAATQAAFGSESRVIRSAVALPLTQAPFGCSGTIAFAWVDPERGASEWEPICRDFAEKASAAITRGVLQARLQSDLKRKLEEMTHLREIGLQFNLETDLKTLMSAILSEALREAHMDSGVVRLYDSERKLWILMTSEGGFSEEADPPEIESDPTLKKCLETHTRKFTAGDDPEWLDFVRALPGPRRAHHNRVKKRLAVPLQLKDNFIGAILLASLTDPREPEPDTIEYLEVLSQYASFSIYSAQQRQKEIELAQPFAMIGAMLSGFLHVMRNKINNAVATLSNLSDSSLPESARATKLRFLDSDLQRLAEICRDVQIGFSPEKEPSRQRIDLNVIVDRAWNGSPGVHSEGVHPERRYADPPPVMRGNEMQLEIAVRMLIQNAVEAIKGEGKIWLRTKRLQHSVVILVGDNGSGMDNETLRQATRPFFTTKGAAGNGLGLAVVLGIVTRHHGKLRIRSKPSVGSVFSMTFPV